MLARLFAVADDVDTCLLLIVYRQVNHPRRLGRKSRFYGSNFWQAYFVEAMALLEGSAILFIRGAEYKLDPDASRFHYPVSATFSIRVTAEESGRRVGSSGCVSAPKADAR